LAHILIGEPVPTPDQVRGRLSPEYALVHGKIAADISRRSARYRYRAIAAAALGNRA